MTDHVEQDDRFSLDMGQLVALQNAADEPAGRGDDLGFACNATPDEHIHARRVGHAGSRLGGRASIAAHGANGYAVVFLAAPEARRLAAHLLTIADDLDGVTPLVFTPPPFGYYVAEDASGDPCVWRERPERSLGDECVARYSTDLTDGRAWDDLFANLPRREVVDADDETGPETGEDDE